MIVFAPELRTLLDHETCSSCQGRAASPSYPVLFQLTLRLALTFQGRYFAPTSATDLTCAHSKIAMNPGGLIPGRAAFDDALQLRMNRALFPFVAERELSSTALRCFPDPAFSAVVEAGVSPSDPSATLCLHPFYGANPACQAHFHHPCVNKSGFLEPRCLPSTSAPV